MSSFPTSQHPRRRGNGPQRRPLARNNSSLLGTIKNIVTAPLTWFAATDDFDDPTDLKGKRRRNPVARSPTAMDDVDGPPRSKRIRVQSPDNQVQFHPEPQYAPSYPNPPHGYLDPPEMAFTNSPSRSNSVNAPPTTLSQYNATRSLFRTMSIDPPHIPAPISREPSMNLYSTPFDRDTSMERASSAIPRDLSMPLPTTRSPMRIRSSLTPQPSMAREVSEPPSLSILAQKPVFVRAPTESHQRLSSQSSTSTLGSLVDSQRRTRSPMRQHSSLLFGSGTHEHEASTSTRQPVASERALHELDVYKTPLLPTRSRLRAGGLTDIKGSGDASDLFRSRRRSQLLLMRDDKRPKRLGHTEEEYPFLEPEKPKEKEAKKVNETKPYAGEGGMKKLLARRMKEAEEEEEEVAKNSPPKPAAVELSKPAAAPLPPTSQDWGSLETSQPASSGSSLRVGRIKTSRNHIARPARPNKKFSAAYEEEADDMDDDEAAERLKQLQELEDAAKKVPAFNVPTGFSFAKEPPPIAAEADAKEPPIAALPFSFGQPSAPPAAAPVAPKATLAAEAVPPVAKPLAPPFALGLGAPPKISLPPPVKEAVPEPEKTSGGIPNFFGSSKLLSQPTPAPSLPPSTMPLFGTPPAAPSLGTPPVVPSSSATPTPSLFPPAPPAATAPLADLPQASSSETASLFPTTPVPAPAPAAVPTPIRDTENPFWVSDAAKRDAAQSLFAPKTNEAGNGLKAEGTALFGGATFGATATKAPSAPLFSAPAASTTGGFSFGAPAAAPTVAAVEAPKVAEPPKFSFGAPPTSAPLEAPKSASFSFGAPTTAADAPKPFSFGATTTAPASNPFASATVSEAPKPAFGSGGGFSFNQSANETSKPTPAFSFGSSATDEAKPASSPAPFSFGGPSSAPPSTTSFSFGANNDNKSTPFSFGAASSSMVPARPVTPPRNEPPEFKMDESPTREPAKPVETRPSLNSGAGFSFGASSNSGSMFGSTAPSSTPFSFGSPSGNNANPFGPTPTTTENKPFGSSDFGRPTSSSSATFTFGQNNTTTEPPRPTTSGSFSFGASTPTNNSFTFGASTLTTSNAPANPFASQLAPGSAPNSPSTFGQSFSFGGGASTAPQSTPFTFGSTPASPAGGLSTLPQPATPGGFGSAPSFGGGNATPGGGGGSLFTIGAAPPQQRAMKKLPRRKN
ncbi:hypothetical protein MKEN_01067600 [Mycena kentingensis (nom. inval.)]|nr:hypothetical protein MKEN_01067600 [Mycena kentingensis (nom. inval.)]